jgi:xanthine dehydrogenase accessory factor
VRDILADLDLWQAQGEEVALATVIQVHRSIPRLPGARLAMTRSGRMAGSVSGGCVEADVFERAIQTLHSGQPTLVKYGIADESAFQVGLSCGGSIEVLIELFIPDSAWEALRQAVEYQQPAAFAVGLAPHALLGRKLTMLEQGKWAGSIDSSLDRYVAAEGRCLLKAGGTKIARLPWQEGEAQVFLEGFPPSPDLFIVGATHTAIPLCRMAREVGFRVTVIDARSVLATRERFPDADQIVQAWPDESLSQMPLGDRSFVVLLTHDPKFDVPTLASTLRSPARYIGVLGGRVTHENRKAKLRQQGFSDADLARIHSPIGLDIGSRTPEELAVAILAEIVAVKYSVTERNYV